MILQGDSLPFPLPPSPSLPFKKSACLMSGSPPKWPLLNRENMGKRGCGHSNQIHIHDFQALISSPPSLLPDSPDAKGLHGRHLAATVCG